MDRTILTWTPANWVTVLIMVTLGGAIAASLFALIGVNFKAPLSFQK